MSAPSTASPSDSAAHVVGVPRIVRRFRFERFVPPPRVYHIWPSRLAVGEIKVVYTPRERVEKTLSRCRRRYGMEFSWAFDGRKIAIRRDK